MTKWVYIAEEETSADKSALHENSNISEGKFKFLSFWLIEKCHFISQPRD